MTPSLIDAAIVIGTIVLTTLFLLLISGQLHDTTAGNLIARSPAPALDTIVNTQPAPTQSVPGPASPTPPASRPTATPSSVEEISAADDTTIQAAVDKKIQDNPELSAYVLTIAVSDGKVTLDGTLPSRELKEKLEKLVKTVSGVKQVDNQVAVIGGN